VSWAAERTSEFDEWWEGLTDQEQRKVVASVEALQELGPSAGRPLADTVEGSRHPNMKELRITQTMRIFLRLRSREDGDPLDRRRQGGEDEALLQKDDSGR
jgi:hypothetical protein